MRTWAAHFNIILLLLGLAAGCSTTREKELSVIRFHLEANSRADTDSIPVPIYRAQPTSVRINPSPFLDERDVTHAEVVDGMDGFAIQIQFDRHGIMALENVTLANRGRRLAIFCAFDKQTRWLAAPVMRQPISDGILIFTPDASREEAERIVSGLNLMVKKIKRKG